MLRIVWYTCLWCVGMCSNVVILLLHQEKMNVVISSPFPFLLHSLLHQGVHSWWLLQLHAPQTHFKGREVGQPMMCPPARVCLVLFHCYISCSSAVTAVFFVTVWCQLPSPFACSLFADVSCILVVEGARGAGGERSRQSLPACTVLLAIICQRSYACV